MKLQPLDMNESLIIATERLLTFILKEDLKQPDKYGNTLLNYAAKELAHLNALTPNKKFYEEVVCNLVNSFEKFNQTNLAELESYILDAGFSGDKIVDKFTGYVLEETESEDLVFKACVARLIQNLSKNAFTLDYILSRFKKLENLDPWLWAELIVVCNWEYGVHFIKTLLSTVPDTSYLFALMPSWIIKLNNPDKISFAVNEWMVHFNENDRKIIRYYEQNYGLNLRLDQGGTQAKSEIIDTIINGSGFRKFVAKIRKPDYETLEA